VTAPETDEETEMNTLELARFLAHLPPEQIVDVDVRDALRGGREPFGQIMAARAALPPGSALRVRAIFEPVPLYAVLGRQGLDHWTERLADDDWRVWFFKAVAAPPEPEAGKRAPLQVEAPDTVVLDVRDMEPPEPMMQTLAALERLPEGGTLVQVNVRVPRFLFPRLTDAGYEFEVREESDGLVRTFIRRRQEPRPNHEEEAMSLTDDSPVQLDVRVIPPREKHPAIFQTFDSLEPGQAFVLVNDHDPFPLRYQFEAERPDAFAWEYLEKGPTVWRVLISRP
jgi:uncharacterized protein (DUF2249 family)